MKIYKYLFFLILIALQFNNLKAAIPSNFEKNFKETIHYSSSSSNEVGYIVIDDKQSGINQGTWLYVKKALDYYKEHKPIFIILELNTPGGEVFAAQKISDALKEMDVQYNIPIVAFINNWAISAGAMLAYSCRFITVVKDGSMGAAEPVIAEQTTGQMKEASEKVNSALRADFANRASFFDRNPYIAEAMVDKDIILVLRDGNVIKLDSESDIKKEGAHPDKIISPKGKLLTLNAHQLVEFGIADALVNPTKLSLITPKEKAEGSWPASKSLVFQAPLFNEIPNAVIKEYQMDWKTRFLAFLSNPLVSSMLFLGMMLAFYIEMNTPGVGLPAALGLICLFLIILSSFALEIGNILELILLISGIIIVVADLFFLPTFGILGTIGAIFFFIGLFGLMLPGIGSIDYEGTTNTLNAAGQAFLDRLILLSLTLVVGVVIMFLLSRYFLPKFSTWNRFVLSGNEQEASLGYTTGENPELLPKVEQIGVALTTLRPSGKIIVNDTIYDAITTGSFIEKGETVKVVRLDGSTIVVQVIEEGN
ncbi:MAG: hypothetical protein BGO10_10825 [Chlamydia sp. 32-24]|nr:MAG: hypothetical protein BGO10_10825 [Chlamydia sp. 32-24]